MDKDLDYNKLEDFRKILAKCNILKMDKKCFVDYILPCVRWSFHVGK